MQATLEEAQTNLASLLDKADAGEEVVIDRPGKPSIRLLVQPAKPVRQFGQFKGQFKMTDDFDSPLVNDEITTLFEGE